MKLVLSALFGIIFLGNLSQNCFAQLKQERIRRITVFPIKVEANDPREVNKAAEEAWWDAREKLTESKRFSVASKNFMQAKDVFQPRGDLQPADAIILGRLLDANMLLTIFLHDRRLSLRAYEARNGLTIWKGDIDLHPAVPVSTQISESVLKLILDLTSAFPYQGHVIVDNFIGYALYTESDRRFFKADVGLGTQIIVGDVVELINVEADQLKPLFQDGATISVYGEGRVVNVDRQIITVELNRLQEKSQVLADSLIRVPDELRRMKEVYGIHNNVEKNISFGVVDRVNVLEEQKQREIKPLVASLSWIGNLLVIILLAF